MNREELIKEAYEYGCALAVQELVKTAEGEGIVGGLGAIPLVGPLAAGVGGAAAAPKGEGIRGALGGGLGSLVGGLGGAVAGGGIANILGTLLSHGKIKSIGPIASGRKVTNLKSLSDMARVAPPTSFGPHGPAFKFQMHPTYRDATRQQKELIDELGKRARKVIPAGILGGGMLGGGLGAAGGYDLLTSSPEEE